MTTSILFLLRALRSFRLSLLAPALALCGLACAVSAVRADALTFTVDSSQSYVTLNIPNFVYSGNTINLTGQNRTNGAPIGTAWSTNTNTGNTAFVSGTFATTVGGSLSGQTLTSIEFIAGANNLTALNSGNYRPNPAAYNAITTAYNNNLGAPGNYGSTIHTILGNAGMSSFENTVYDIGSTAGPQAASGTVGTGSINTAAGLNAGVLSSVFSVQGFVLFIAGQVLPNDFGTLDSSVAPNLAAGGVYNFTSPTNLQVTVPLSVPFSIDLGGGTFLNGTASGQFVGNAAVPEPSTLALAGLAMVSLVAIVRRRRKQQA